MLFQFVIDHRSELVGRAQAKAAKRLAPRPPGWEGETGVPLFLDQLVETLRGAPASMPGLMDRSAAVHGATLLGLGYTVGQVVHDYGDVCQAITELAGETDARISTREFHTMNLCLDNAIAEAITEYTRLRDRSIADAETTRSGAFAHELRNRISAAQMGFDAIRSGRAPLVGGVAAIVTRSLKSMSTLIDQVLVDVRVDSGSTHRQRIPLHKVIEEVRSDGALGAESHGVSLAVSPTDPGLAVEADGQILAGAISNLLQNAFKFTRKGGRVWLRTSTVDERAWIEIEDECGGLPAGRVEELFEPFQQRARNRVGLGLGLYVSRKGVEASGGSLRVRDIPGTGCVFTIDLPLAGPSAAAPTPASS
jgi:signal transduction histidine kinase